MGSAFRIGNFCVLILKPLIEVESGFCELGGTTAGLRMVWAGPVRMLKAMSHRLNGGEPRGKRLICCLNDQVTSKLNCRRVAHVMNGRFLSIASSPSDTPRRSEKEAARSVAWVMRKELRR